MKKLNSLVLILFITLALSSCATASGGKTYNLALGSEITATTPMLYFVSENAVDGDVLTYFEGNANEYPNMLTVDLGRPTELGELKVRLNPRRLWQDRKQTFEVQVSMDGSDFLTAVESVEYLFSSDENENSATVQVGQKGRFVRIIFTSNSEATGGQVAELEIYKAN